jgi:erythromycin esterase-like protein
MTTHRLFAFGLALAVITTLAQGSAPTPAQLAWLKANAIEVKTVDAGTGFADLQQLKAAVGSARIVSLGEATHGTREIFQMKHRLIEFLASELGFAIFSIEANMPEAYRLNDYVLHGTGDPKALLQGMYFWTWNTEEVLAMIEWMRQFNATGKGHIQFTGFDMQTIRVAVDVVGEFLRKVDADYATAVRTDFADASNLQPAQSGFGVATGTFPVSAAAGRKITFSGAIKTREVDGFAGLWWRADGPKGPLAFDNMQGRAPNGTSDWKRYEVVLEIPRETVNINFGVLMPGTGTAWFDDLRVEIDGKPYDATELFDFDFESGATKGFVTPARGYTARVDDATASHGSHSLRIESQSGTGVSAKAANAADVSRRLAEVVGHMEKARAGYLKQASAQTVDWATQNARIVQQYAQMVAGEVSRDESMARNVKWILDNNPGARLVVWAHNGHVGRIGQGNFRAMGSYLSDWYGKDYVPVGFAVNRGEYTAIGGGSLGRHPLSPGEPGSYEYVFARSEIPRFILDLRMARAGDPASGWLRTPMQLRSIGAMAMDSAHQFAPATLGDVFDLLVFLEQTTATRSVTTPR